MRCLTLLLAVLVASQSVTATVVVTDLFIPRITPVVMPIDVAPLPPNTSVFTVNRNRFDQLNAQVQVGSTIKLSIPLAGSTEPTVVEVRRFTVFAQHARLVAVRANETVALNKPQSLLLRGTVAGQPNAPVFLALYPDKAFGRVQVGDVVYELNRVPVHTTVEGKSTANSDQICAFIDASLLPQNGNWQCHSQEEAQRILPGRSAKDADRVQASYTISVALEGDYDYYLDHNSSSDDATEYAEAVIASASDIYDRDVNTTLTIGSWTLWTSTDPYTGTSASSLLGQLKTYWQNNHSGVDRTVTHLFSGINGIGGVAYLDGLCNKGKGYSVAGLNSTYTYPSTSYTWDTDATAHELGHNVGSPHTHSCSWNPPIDSCYDSEGGCFTQTVARKGTIMSYCHLTNQGKVLKFHNKVIELMEQYLDAAECMPQGASLTVNAGSDVTVCGGTTVDFEGSVAGGVEPYEITWTPNDNMTGVNTYTPSVVATTTTSYVMTVMDADSTIVSDTVLVTVNPQVVLTAADTVDVCKGSAVTLSVNVTGGTGTKTFTWNVNGVENNTNINSYTFTPTASTTVGLLVTDTKACNANDAIYVRVNNVPKLSLTGPTGVLCADDKSALKAKIVGGTPPYSFSWSSKDGVFSSQPDSVIVSPDSNQSYNLRITDAKGCTDTAVVSVSVHNVKMALSTDKLLLTSLGACQSSANVWITIINNGDIPFTIEGVSAKSTVVTSKDFPVTIPPNSSHLLPLKLDLPAVSPIIDTLIFAETLCKKPYKVAISGERGGISGVVSTQVSSVIQAQVCSRQVPINFTVDVLNSATKSANVVSATTTSGAKTTIAGAPVVIGANSTVPIQIQIHTPVTAGTNVDTLMLSYNSEDCSARISVPVSYQGIDVVVTMADTLVFTDTVSQMLEDVSKQLEIVPSFTGLPDLQIGSVTVTGPFSTALMQGTALDSATTITTTVTFHPSQMDADGIVEGSMSFTAGDCADAYTVALRGQRTVVSVNEESNSSTPQCWLTGTTVFTQPQDVAITIYDVAGNIVARRQAGITSPLSLGTMASGIYVAVMTQHGSSNTIVPLMLTR